MIQVFLWLCTCCTAHARKSLRSARRGRVARYTHLNMHRLASLNLIKLAAVVGWTQATPYQLISSSRYLRNMASLIVIRRDTWYLASLSNN